MIKVLINGTPIYRLEFNRKVRKVIGRKRLTAKQALNVIRTSGNYPTDIGAIAKALRAAEGGKPLYETTATIHIIDAKPDEPAVAVGVSKQHKLDDNRKVVGRGIALKNLLHAQRDNKDIFTEIERNAIREAYNNRFKQGSKPTPPIGSAGTPPIAQKRKLAPVVGTITPAAPRPGLTLKAA